MYIYIFNYRKHNKIIMCIQVFWILFPSSWKIKPQIGLRLEGGVPAIEKQQKKSEKYKTYIKIDDGFKNIMTILAILRTNHAKMRPMTFSISLAVFHLVQQIAPPCRFLHRLRNGLPTCTTTCHNSFRRMQKKIRACMQRI